MDHYQTVRLCKDGRRIDVSVTISPIKDGSGAVVGASKIARDITEQRRAEAQLRRHQAMLSSAVRIAGLGSWDYDVAEDRLEWSDETLLIFGIKREQFAGNMSAFLSFVHPEDRVRMEGMQGQSLKCGGFVEMEYRILRPNGEERIVYDRGETTCSIAGKPIRRTGMVLDITERKRAVRRIEYLNRVYAVLSDINETIVREKDPQKLLAAACRIAVEKGQFRMAWVGRLDERSKKSCLSHPTA